MVSCQLLHESIKYVQKHTLRSVSDIVHMRLIVHCGEGWYNALGRIA